MTRTALVTGAAGFVGSHLVEALVARGDRVRALVRYSARPDLGNLDELPADVRASVDVRLGDLNDPHMVRAAVKGCDVVFHLGAIISIPQSYVTAAHVFQTNVLGSLHVAQACLEEGAKMVHTSTSEVYGTAQTVPITEDHPLVGQSPYAASKIGADQCVESYHRSFGLRAVTVRPFNTYGPRQSARAVLVAIAVQALHRHEVRLGALHPTRDLNYVGDTVRGFLLAAERDEAVGRTLNLAQGKEISVGDLARKVIRAAGRDVPVVCDAERVRPAASEVERLCGDATRARAVLGWAPEVSLDEGVARVVEYVRARPERFRPERYTA
ncbi:MAG: SDR family NAD(P)-dependent oxidoreductase [Polyangiales bacterium]